MQVRSCEPDARGAADRSKHAEQTTQNKNIARLLPIDCRDISDRIELLCLQEHMRMLSPLSQELEAKRFARYAGESPAWHRYLTENHTDLADGLSNESRVARTKTFKLLINHVPPGARDAVRKAFLERLRSIIPNALAKKQAASNQAHGQSAFHRLVFDHYAPRFAALAYTVRTHAEWLEMHRESMASANVVDMRTKHTFIEVLANALPREDAYAAMTYLAKLHQSITAPIRKSTAAKAVAKAIERFPEDQRAALYEHYPRISPAVAQAG